MAKSKKNVVHEVIRHEWTNKIVNDVESSDGYKEARVWQAEAHPILSEARLAALNAPMGCGKSVAMEMSAVAKMKNDPKLRTIISVPQTIIANGFLDSQFILPGTKKKIHWKPRHNLCDGGSTNNIERVVDFLAQPAGRDLNDRILVCTHATLLGVYKRLRQDGRLEVFNRLVLWIDEAHHVKNAEMIDVADVTLSNGIGEIVKHIVHSKKRSLHLGLATASFFRGDRCTLITEDMEKKFVRYNLPYDKYLENMKHLKSFTFSFGLCGRDYIPAVQRLMKRRRGKDIIHIPRPNSKESLGDKYRQVDRIVEAAKKIHGGKVQKTTDGLTTLQKRTGSSFKILDLVDETDRDAKKAFTTQINQDRNALDSIVALGMFKEGADWVHADRSIIIGTRQSLVDVIQMVGRLFRDCPGKEHVEVIQLLPWTLEHTDRQEFREKLNNFLKTVYSSMILKNVLAPVQIQHPQADASTKPGGQGPRTNPLTSLLPDESQQEKCLELSGNAMMRVADENGDDASREDYVKAVVEVLKGFKVPQDEREHLADYIHKTFQSQAYLWCQDASEIDIDLVQEVNPVRWIVDYTNRECGINTFRELRRVLSVDGKVFPSYEKAKELWQAYAKKHNIKPTMDEYRKHVRRDISDTI